MSNTKFDKDGYPVIKVTCKYPGNFHVCRNFRIIVENDIIDIRYIDCDADRGDDFEIITLEK